MNRRNYLMIALLALCFVLANHSFYIYLWTAPVAENTGLWSGFRSIGLSLSDSPLLLFVALGCIALMSNNQLYLEFSALGKAIILNYGGYWFLILFIWMVCSSLWAGEKVLSRFDTIHYFLELAAGFGVAYLVSKGWEKALLIAFVVVALVQSILAILQLWRGESLGLSWLLEPIRDVANPFGYLEQGFRGYGLERHPNLLAGSLFLAMFACFLYWNSPWFKAALAIIALGIVASLSRTVIVIAGFSVLLFVLLQGNWSRRQSLIGILLGGLLGVVAIGLFGQQIWADLQERTLLYLQYPAAFFERLSFADGDTIAVWLKSPYLGIGAGNLPLEIAHLRAGFSGLLLPVHNVFLYVLAELGIVGFAALFMGISSAWGRAHRANSREIQIFAVSIIGLSLIMCFDFYFWEEMRLRMLFFLWMGLYWGYCWRSNSRVA